MNDAAVNLPLGSGRVDDATAVSDHHILEQGYAAGEGIDLQFDGVYANAVGQSRCLEIHRRFQAWCDPRRDLVAGRSRQRICYFAQGDGNIFAMFHDDPVANIQFLLRNPENESCSRDRLFTHGASCQVNGASRGDSLAASKTAETELYCGSIAADHGYVFRPDADLIAGDLCENRLEALPHCHCSGDDRDLPGATNANNGRLERAAPGAFKSHGDTETQKATLRPRLFTARLKSGRIGAGQSKIQTCREIATFVYDRAGRTLPHWGRIWNHVGRDRKSTRLNSS